MDTFRERAIKLANDCKRVKNNNVYRTLSKEFKISERTAGDRFKSLFGKPVRDYISDNLIPTKQELIDCIIQSNSYIEMYRLSNINDISKLPTLLEKYFNYSNYNKVKLNLLAKIPCENYYPLREDNISILISQWLGDGSFERSSCLSITHGYKQYDYLKFKISLLNKAFPTTNGLEAIYKRIDKNYYVSYRYRTGQVLKKQIEGIETSTMQENINKLTPFGVCLYFLDDGWFTHSTKYSTVELGFGTICIDKRNILFEFFKTYGYKFNISKNRLTLQSKENVIKFINDFIKPYDHLLPKCIQYKYNYKDIVG